MATRAIAGTRRSALPASQPLALPCGMAVLLPRRRRVDVTKGINLLNSVNLTGPLMVSKTLISLLAWASIVFGCAAAAEEPNNLQTPQGRILAIYGDPTMSFRAGSRRLLVYGLPPKGALDVFGSTTIKEAFTALADLEAHDPDQGCWLFFELEDPGYVTSSRRSENCSADKHPIFDLKAAPPQTRLSSSEKGSRSIRTSDLTGSWIEADRYATSQSFLIFSDDGSVCISEQSSCQPDSDMATYEFSAVDGLFTVTHLDAGEVSVRYVFGGWISANNRVLFGTKYLYYDGAIINGLSMTLLPVD